MTFWCIIFASIIIIISTKRKNLNYNKHTTIVDCVFCHARLTAGIDNTLFHYVSWDSFHGIVVCPNDGDAPTTGGLVHAEVVNTFQKTCLSMRRLFSPYYKQVCRKTILQ